MSVLCNVGGSQQAGSRLCHHPDLLSAATMTHHEAEASLQVDVPDATVAFEEPLHVLLPGRGAQAADEDPTAAHLVLLLRCNKHEMLQTV